MAEFRLIIMRHGESGMDAPSDHARVLTGRGRDIVAKAADKLLSVGWVPAEIWSSDANRTKETTDLLLNAFGVSVTPSFKAEYYLGAGDLVLESLKTVEPAVRTLALVGHNPTWSVLVSSLTEDYVALSPANAALVKIEADSWEQAIQMQGAWELVQII